MKTLRCTKCKWFRRSKAKVRTYDRGNGIRMSASSPIELLGTYYCKNRWWNYPSQSYFKNNDVCEDFEFKTNKD
jgi:hypothetical protein